MKKIALALSLLAAVSCSWIDLGPTNALSPSQIWSGDETVLDGYVYGLYACVRDKAEIFTPAARNMFTDAYSDLVKSGSWDQYGHTYNSILMEPNIITSDNASVFEIWDDSYVRIKRENEFLRDSKTYEGNFSPEFLKTRIAEVRFLRAFSYYYLIRVYAGVVIRDELGGVDGPSENDKPRSSEADSWSWVMWNLRAAAEDLPEAWDGAEYGRATKAAAYGYLSRAALYKACALKNSAAPADSVRKAYLDVIEAADACKAHGGDLVADYASVFSNQVSAENLFTVSFFSNTESPNLSHEADRHFRPKGDQATHGGATVSSTYGPTEELAGAFEMADGTPFDWAVHGASPFTGREPRFYATILYNGASWEGRKLECYPGGADGFGTFQRSGCAEASVTGYYLRKWITEYDERWASSGSSHYWIALRYAEVLLNKAEAEAQSGSIPDALTTLNLVRSRVGLPDATASSLEEFMKVLEHERIVELAGEGFRYWDLRRWRRAVDVINGSNVHGCKPSPDGSGGFTYEIIDADNGNVRIFKPQYYAFAIPITEMSVNLSIGEQNPGW